MFDAINPLYWWGATAVSVPIIIHLINRLRYRRVRWAAMEFLLKSQKRNRRRLIIEQLLLLLLRCALVLLAVLLVVRPTWLLGGDSARNADLPSYHVVVLDDSLSVQDKAEPQGTAFQDAARLVGDLADRATESSSAHYFTVLKLSDPKNPEIGKPYDQLAGLPPGQQISTNDDARGLRTKLESLECTYLRLPLKDGLTAAEPYFANVKEGNKYLHVVSDFRRRDWAEGNAGELTQLLGEVAHPRGQNVQVRLHDVAHPVRPENKSEIPAGHANVGLTNLAARFRPREGSAAATAKTPEYPVRVVTAGIPVYLHITVRNFSDAEKTGLQLRVKIDGSERAEFSRDVKSISAGEEQTVELPIRFGGEEKLGLKQVAVLLDDSEKKDPLPADNIRYTYLELRKEIPVLLVDPTPNAAGGDSFFVNIALKGNADFGLKPQRIRPSEVKNQKNLDQFAVIFLLNVPSIGGAAFELDADSLKALEGYVQRGGSIVFFLGPRVNVASYNEHLYKNGKGIFPAPLSPRPHPNRPFAFVDERPDEEDFSQKIRFLKSDHPAFAVFQDRTGFLYLMTTSRYFKVDPSWTPSAGTEVVAQVQNRRPLENFRNQAADLARTLTQSGSRFAKQLAEKAGKISEAIADAASQRSRKGPLIEAIDGLLTDPELTAFWAEPSQGQLKQRVTQLHEALIAGDPLIIESTVGAGKTKGRVIAFMTPASPTPIQGEDYSWNDWASQIDPGGFAPYPIMLLDLHSYLAALSRAATEAPVNQLLGAPAVVRLNKERYDSRMQLWHHPEGRDAAVKLADLTAQAEGNEWAARISPRSPGFYLLKLNQPGGEGGGQPKGDAEERPFAFNVDNRDEGVLSRVSEAEVQERVAAALSRPAKEGQEGKLTLTPQESQAFAQGRSWFVSRSLEAATGADSRNKSWSEYAWVLLLFFAILLVEQALAMRLSYHVKDEARPAGGQARAA